MAIVAAAGNIIRSTVAALRTPTGLRPTGSGAQREAIPWRIAKQMRDSGSKAALATGEETVEASEIVEGQGTVEASEIVEGQGTVEG